MVINTLAGWNRNQISGSFTVGWPVGLIWDQVRFAKNGGIFYCKAVVFKHGGQEECRALDAH